MHVIAIKISAAGTWFWFFRALKQEMCGQDRQPFADVEEAWERRVGKITRVEKHSKATSNRMACELIEKWLQREKAGGIDRKQLAAGKRDDGRADA